MARPAKQGLDYFNLDTDFFRGRKVRRLHRENRDGILVFIYLLSEIYRDKGYYIVCDEDFVFDVADSLALEESEVNKIIEICVKIDLFNRAAFERNNVLTSCEIQKRYAFICRGFKRKLTINEDFMLLCSEETGVSGEFPRVEIPQKKGAEKKGEENTSLSEAEEREKVLEIFFFKKITNPAQELDAFWAHYQKTGWLDANGNRIVMKTAAAKNWRCKNGPMGVDDSFYRIWREVFLEFGSTALEVKMVKFSEVENALKIEISKPLESLLRENDNLQKVQRRFKVNLLWKTST